MSRHRHDRPCAVADQDVVGDPNGNPLPIGRIYSVPSGEDSALLSPPRNAVLLAHHGHSLTISFNLRAALRRREPLQHWVLGRQHHVGSSKKRIGTRGINPDGFGFGGGGKSFPGSFLFPIVKNSLFPTHEEIYFGPLAAPHPVALHLFDGVGPVKQFEVLDQPVGIGGNAQHPLPQRDSLHRMIAAV